jgi:hypothetical protein
MLQLFELLGAKPFLKLTHKIAKPFCVKMQTNTRKITENVLLVGNAFFLQLTEVFQHSRVPHFIY